MKKIILTLIFFVGFFMVQSQEKKEKPSASSPAMGKSSESTTKRLATTVEPDRKFSYAERELDYLTHIWEGEYDNVEQLDFDKIQAKEGEKEQAHERVHVSVRQFQNSNFGVGAVYLEEYRNNDPKYLTRQCIYQLVPDDVEKALRVNVFHFKEKAPFLNGEKGFKAVSQLTPKSEVLEAGCPMLLRREGNGFKASMLQKDCPNTASTIDYGFAITEADFSFWEGARVNEKPLSASLEKSPYMLEKARCFSCMVDFPNDTNGRPTITKHYIDIWDQGGVFEFDYPDGRQMLLGMRNTWSFGMHRETFVIYILDQETKKTLVYSWGEPGSDRIGMNPGWIRVQCDLATQRNRKLQQELRPGS